MNQPLLSAGEAPTASMPGVRPRTRPAGTPGPAWFPSDPPPPVSWSGTQFLPLIGGVCGCLIMLFCCFCSLRVHVFSFSEPNPKNRWPQKGVSCIALPRGFLKDHKLRCCCKVRQESPNLRDLAFLFSEFPRERCCAVLCDHLQQMLTTLGEM